MPLRIEAVEIRDFRSHAETILNFGDLNFIVGPNGSGKTSILDAIAICLMGRTPTAPARSDAFNAQIREGSGNDSFNVFIKTNRGARRVIWTGGRSHSNGDLEIPPKFPTLLPFLFTPSKFFDGSVTVRYQAISDLIGIDLAKVKKLIKSKSEELALPGSIKAFCDLSGADEIKPLIARMKEERKEAGRKADLYAAFASSDTAPVDTTELVKVKCDVEAFEENFKVVGDLLATLDNETVRTANEKWAALVEEIDHTQSQYNMMQGARVYADHRKCPLKMICPMPLEEWQKCEKKTKALEMELQVKLERLKAERSSLEEIRVNLANMDVWQIAYNDMEARLPEIKKKKEWYEANLIKAGQAEDASEKKALYDKYGKLEGALDTFVKYLERDIVPACASADKFNKMLAASPYKIEFKSGEIFWNGRLYEYCSTSQQFRCRIALQSIIGQDVGFMVVDGFEALDAKGKAENMKVLKELVKDGFQVFVSGSYCQPYDGGIPVRSISGMTMVWCELDAHGVTQAKVI